MKFLITYEEFTELERQKLIDNGETYLYKKIHDEKYDAVVENKRYGITFNDIKLDNKLIDKINEIGWI